MSWCIVSSVGHRPASPGRRSLSVSTASRAGAPGTARHCTKLSRVRNWLWEDRGSEIPESVSAAAVKFLPFHYYSLYLWLWPHRYPAPGSLWPHSWLQTDSSSTLSNSAPAWGDPVIVTLSSPDQSPCCIGAETCRLSSHQWSDPLRASEDGVPPDHGRRHGLHAVHRGAGLWPVLLAPHPHDHLILPPDEPGHSNILARVLLTTQLREER